MLPERLGIVQNPNEVRREAVRARAIELRAPSDIVDQTWRVVLVIDDLEVQPLWEQRRAHVGIDRRITCL